MSALMTMTNSILGYHLVRVEEGVDRFTVLPERFKALDEAKAKLESLRAIEPEGRFVIQLSGLA